MIFVTHGFASATPNENTAFLTGLFPEEMVVGLNYPFSPTLAAAFFREAIPDGLEKDDAGVPPMFLGTSLGGFWAWRCAAWFNGIAVLINPALTPWVTLQSRIGTCTNYKTGQHFTLTADDVANYQEYKVVSSKVPLLVLLDEGDELLDSAETHRMMINQAEVITFPRGSHRFDHRVEAASAIRGFRKNYACPSPSGGSAPGL